MTEKEWLECADPGEILCFLEKRQNTPPKRKWPKLTERKQQLFACACCRRIWHRLVDERSRRAVEVAELCADGSVTKEEIVAAAADAYSAATDDRSYDNDAVGAPEYAALYTIGIYDSTGAISTMTPSFNALNAAENTAGAIANRANMKALGEGAWEAAFCAERLAQVGLVREIFGNPFRPIASGSVWLTPNVVQLAQAIYNDRTFDQMPNLSDALMDAGCGDEEILGHCRGSGPHVRGCWVLDLLLGKE
jgi:hypothetical protein